MAENRLIDAQGLARVSRLELVARQAVDGFLSGRHPSPYHGSSVEYADHRPYTISDEIRTIDWKLWAKTDKYYIKLFEEQTNLRCTVLLDCSRSMGYASGKASKHEYGCYLAAAMSYLMLRQNDSVGLALFDGNVRNYLPARSTPSHFRRMLEVMEASKPDSATSIGTVMHELAGRLKRRGLIILISDMLDDPEVIAKGLSHFKYLRHEIIVFHVMDPAELSFPFERLTRFKDIEGGGTLVANPQSLRRRYLERLETFLKRIRQICLERGISYELAPTDKGYDQMLTAYLDRRSRMKGG